MYKIILRSIEYYTSNIFIDNMLLLKDIIFILLCASLLFRLGMLTKYMQMYAKYAENIF